MSEDTIVKLKVRVEKLIYPRFANQQVAGEWGVVACSVIEELEGQAPSLNQYDNLTVKGLLPKIQLDEDYIVVGQAIEDPQWGGQIESTFFSMVFNFDDVEESNSFLRMVLTEAQVNLMLNYFENPSQVLKNKDVEALTKINGIGVKTALKLIDKFEEVQDYSRAYIDLGKLGLNQTWINRLLLTYGNPDTIIDKVKENPYVLIDDVDGVGWAKADEIALNNGFTLSDKRRLKAFICHFLKEEANKGHSWTAPWDIVDALEKNCGEIPFEIRTEVFYELMESDTIWFDEEKTKVALVNVKRLEQSIAKELNRLIKAESKFDYDTFEEIIKTQEQEQGWAFTDEQVTAIQGTLDSNVTIITGFGGTGKTSVVSAVIKILHDYTFAQTALAGRAADRMKEITGVSGYTIHRLLGWTCEGFTYHEGKPLPLDIVILDETSMVGGVLFLNLLKAIPTGKKLIMLGDDGQLEAIGMLNLFADMMTSDVVKTFRLTKIHRQAQKSAIITESINIRNSKQIIKTTDMGIDVRGELQDLVLDLYDEKDYTILRIKHHFQEELKRLRDISKLQVIVPMRNKGDSSVLPVNRMLQKLYNGRDGFSVDIGSPKFPNSHYTLKEGDKVIIRTNNYNDVRNKDGKVVPVFNGNIGIITEIDLLDNLIVLELNTGETVIMPKKTWKTIELAYAITCHSFQGSSADTIIVGVDFSSFTMLTKEWVYTAITRAEKKCIICAQNGALRYATTNTNVPHKRTFLVDMLRKEM